MKKKLRIFESQLIKMIGTIVENIETRLEEYDELDFQEVFFTTFRKWADNKFGDRLKDYPFSHLLRKYGGEFLKESLGEEKYKSLIGYARDEVRFDKWSIGNYGKELVKTNLVKLPTLRKDYKFTEKFAKHLNRFVKMLNLPDIFTVEFKETNPHEVRMLISVDFVDILKQDQMVRVGVFERKIKELLEDYLGVEFDSPVYGGLNFQVVLLVNGEQEWIKNVLNKEIKKYIKTQIPGGQLLHSIRFKPKTESYSDLDLIFKDSARYADRNRWEIRDRVKAYIESLGYKNISVTNV